MIEIQLAARETLATVLTSTLIASKDVEAAKPYPAPRNPVIRDEQNDARNPDDATNKTNGLIVD